jgi:hypothetical protein
VYSLRGKTDGRKIGPYDNVAGKSALRDRFLVIRFRQEYPPACMRVFLTSTALEPIALVDSLTLPSYSNIGNGLRDASL